MGLLMFVSLPILAQQTGKPQTAPEFRRVYPGAKDDSDLTVQVLKPVTRKGGDIEAEDFSSVEPPEEENGGEAQAPAGFGE